uniref:Uncharacterized protein n=1 Tax=Helianthus annuus TaxID=4232 RepID=A0A251UEG9_HELAN
MINHFVFAKAVNDNTFKGLASVTYFTEPINNGSIHNLIRLTNFLSKHSFLNNSTASKTRSARTSP